MFEVVSIEICSENTSTTISSSHQRQYERIRFHYVLIIHDTQYYNEYSHRDISKYVTTLVSRTYDISFIEDSGPNKIVDV